ncbi:MAG TPA: EsaB/YukD family protein [Streptosporangiaceae bacterium]|nr:EsaB/YukD family protein [Streptosporangiaceae bacterium]
MDPAKHQLVRVTVVSPLGQHEIDLPADSPVSAFLPDLLSMAGLQLSQARLASDGWHLTDPTGRPIPAHSSLSSRGIRPGSSIQLRRPLPGQPDDAQLRSGVGMVRGAVSMHLPRVTVAGPAPDDDLDPLERARAVLPPTIGRAVRLRAVGQAFLRKTEEKTEGEKASRGSGARSPEAGEDASRSPAALMRPGFVELPEGDEASEHGPAAEGVSGPGLNGSSAHSGGGERTQFVSRERSSPEPPARPEGSSVDAAKLAVQPAGRHRYRPADLTIEAPPSRLDRARAKWRELDNLGRLDARITEPRLLHCATIAVVSPKGGVGKTTVTALLGTLFSLLRRDPVVAVDTNPDFGSLGRVLTPEQSWYVDDLARLVLEDDELSLTSLDSLLGRAVHGLLVVPAPTEPDRMAAVDEEAYRRVITRLKDFFSLILLDCGTGLQDPALAAAIAGADQVVLLTDAQPATASLVAESTELLHQWGRPITVVVNRMPPKGAKLDIEALSHYLPAARGLVVVPDDVVAATRLATGRFNWRDAPESWQYAVRKLATVLVADWERLGLARLG